MGRIRNVTKNATVGCVRAMCGATGWTVGLAAHGARAATGLTKRAMGGITRGKKRPANVKETASGLTQSRFLRDWKKRPVDIGKSAVGLTQRALGRITRWKKHPGDSEKSVFPGEKRGKAGSYENETLAQAVRDVSDAQPSKRYNAVLRLANLGITLGKDAVSQPLIHALSDTNGNIRCKACHVLTDLKAGCAVSEMTGLLQDNNPRVRLEALRGIYKLSSDSYPVIRYLIDATREHHSEIRKRAATYLGWVESEEAFDPLVNLLSDKESIVRNTAVLALGELRDPRAIEPLISLLSDKDSQVREMVVYTLHILTNQDFEYDPQSDDEGRSEAINKWERWWDSNRLTFKIHKRAFVVSDESVLDYWERVKKEEQSRQESEEESAKEAGEKARRGAEEKARREVQEKAREESQEKARKDAESKARQETEEKARRESEDKARQETEEKARRDAENKAGEDAQEKARKDSQEKAGIDTGEKIKEVTVTPAEEDRGTGKKKRKRPKKMDKDKVGEKVGTRLEAIRAKRAKREALKGGRQKSDDNLKTKMDDLDQLLTLKEGDKPKE